MPHSAPPSPIALERFRRGWTQTDLAARAGRSLGTIHRLERGEMPLLDTARRVAAALDSDVERLFPDLSSVQRGGRAAPGTPSAQASAVGVGRHVEV